MAEFGVVIRCKDRLCKTKDFCYQCLLAANHNGKGMSCDELAMKCPEEFESIVMKWAKENPMISNKQRAIKALTEIFGKEITENFICGNFICSRTGCNGFNSSICNGKCSECEYKGFWEKEYQPPKEQRNE